MLLDIVKAGTTDYSVVIRIVDATDGTPETGVAWNTAGIDLWYRRPQAAHTSITEATQTESGAHSDGGFVHISDGYYRLDLPDAAVASGVDYVDVGGTVTGMVVIGGRIRLEANTVGDVYTRLGAPAGASIAADIATVDSNVDAILVDTGTSGVIVATNNDKTGYRLSATGVDDVWDEALSGHVAAGSAGASLYIVRSGTAQAGAATTITLDASASAVDDFYNNQLIFIVSGTGAGQGRIIEDYVGSTKVATVATWGTNPSSDSVFVIRPFGSIPGATAPTAADNAAAVWGRSYSSDTAEGTYGSLFQPFHEGTAQAGASASITLDATGSSSTTDFYKYAVIQIVDGTGAGQSRQITAYNGTSKVATVDPSWTTQPSTDSQYIITSLGIDAATTTQIASAVWDRPRASHISAGSFGEYVHADAVRISGQTAAADGLEAAVAGTTPLPANVTQISGDSVAADNLESYTDGSIPMPVNVSQISGDSVAADNLEAALDGTGGVTIDAAIEIRSSGGSAGHNASDLVNSMLTTQMTEAYAADGAAPTVAQALLAIQQFLFDKDVSGTTLTVRRLDGTTAAMTFTLDSGSAPTDINRTG